MKRILVYTVSYLSLIGTGYAQTCKPVPSCAELGYTTPANEVASKPQCLKCPFDANYYYCPDLCWEYPLTSCEGSYCKKCDYGNFYRMETPACEYTSTSLPTGCSVADSCEISGTTYYDTVCSECQNGYNDDDGDGICIANTCSGYTSTSSSITGCQTVSSACLSGTTNKYKCDTCYTGYSLSSGACDKTCTYTATSKPSNCATATGSCQLGSASGNTTYYTTACQTCNNGWTESSGSCVANACTGYTSTSSSIANCSTTSSCQKGATTVYKCDACATDYELVNGSCIQSCALTSTTKPSNCTTATETCTKDGTIYYSTTCKTCADGWTVSNGSCVANTCSGYGTSTTGCSSYTTCKSGTTTKYKCTACNGSGYTLSSGQCVANSCSGYGISNIGCTSYTTCLSGTTTKYKCSACADGYSLTNASYIYCMDCLKYTDSPNIYVGQRLSSAYTKEECDASYSNGRPVSYLCAGKTYYACIRLQSDDF